MSSLLFPRRFYNQPQGAVDVDWSNPLTQGLTVAYLPNKIAGASRTYAELKSVGYGIVNARDSANSVTGVNTFFVIANIVAADRDAVLFGRIRYSGSANYGAGIRLNASAVELNKSNGTSAWAFKSYTSAVLTGRHSYAGILKSGEVGALYVDGVLKTSTSDFDGNKDIAAFDGAMDVGKCTASGAIAITDNINGYIEVALHYNRELSAGEVVLLHTNPWQILKVSE